MPSVDFLAGLLLGLPSALLLGWRFRGCSGQKAISVASPPAAAFGRAPPYTSFKPPSAVLTNSTAGKAQKRELAPNRDFQSTQNRLARLQALRNGLTLFSPTGVPLFMVASECIAFIGSEEECSRFLSERGVVTLENVIEPLDLRIQENMDVLGMRVVDCKNRTGSPSA